MDRIAEERVGYVLVRRVEKYQATRKAEGGDRMSPAEATALATLSQTFIGGRS